MHTRHPGIPILLFIGLALAYSPAGAQASAAAVPRLQLAPATGTHPEEFTFISSLRELSDGRVIASDGRENKLLVLDFRDGSSETIGRVGRGPNEYGMVGSVLPTAGDSSLLGDFMGRRWLLLDGARIVVTVPPDDSALKLTQGFVAGADALGRVMLRTTSQPPVGTSETGIHDSSAVTFISRQTGKVDTVAMVRNNPMRRQVSKNDKGEINFMSIMPVGVLVPREEPVLFADGTLAVLRIDPFRVDWRSVSGVWTRGAPLPIPRLRVDARERAAFLERNAAVYKPSPTPSPLPPREPPKASDFPDFIPPYSAGTQKPGPGGTLIVRRSKSADFMQSHYFVIDRRGRLVGELTLPANEEIVGAGPATLYVAVKDEDDIIRLRRHPWK